MSNPTVEMFRKSGRIAAQCREWARETIRPGMTIRELTEGVEEMIRELGGQPAFPAQSSRNHVAAHYCSSPNDTQAYEVGDVVKVDLGVHVDGYVTDTAFSIELGDQDRYGKLIEASAKALEAAIETAGAGVSVGQIGAAVQETIEGYGYKPVRNLTGHGVSRWLVHCSPQIPNVSEKSQHVIRPGQVIAIEPFATDGRGYINDHGTPEVFMMSRRRPPRNMRGLDPGVVDTLMAWNGLPVARRYFREHDPKLVVSTFNRLIRTGELHPYPPLVERVGAMVAQTEHCIYVHDDHVEILTVC
ncbi:MAG: type II methionyl aminopeptidase [Planctomycetes bacterium]|nr:type II methionyl aminopeptidase [Planctomycetota bacterium]MCB9891936.1 type II methionyl aminopeptidase [Planctomycetota bacterium]